MITNLSGRTQICKHYSLQMLAPISLDQDTEIHSLDLHAKTLYITGVNMFHLRIYNQVIMHGVNAVLVKQWTWEMTSASQPGRTWISEVKYGQFYFVSSTCHRILKP